VDGFLWRVSLTKGGKLPTSTDAKLAGLARVENDDIFYRCITLAVKIAHSEATHLAGPVYRRKFVDQFEEIGTAALHLHKLLKALADPKDHTSSWVGTALGHSVNILVDPTLEGDALQRLQPLRRFLLPLLVLAEASRKATRWADLFDVPRKGKPKGINRGRAAVTRFIAHLEISALAAGGSWTLNKNEEHGTLVDALEILRARLSHDFLPRRNEHPYQSYQKILSHVRSEWRRTSVLRDTVPQIGRWLDRK
jgi:hypothetical protein